MNRAYDLFLLTKQIRSIPKAERTKEQEVKIKEGVQADMWFALKDHVKWTEDNSQGAPLHPEIAKELSDYFFGLLCGESIEFLTPIKGKRGTKGRGIKEGDCIGDAVRYIRFVKAGKIIDGSHIKTILTFYGGDEKIGGLSKRTVQSWEDDPRFDHIEVDGMDLNEVQRLVMVSGLYYQQNYTKSARQKIKANKA